MPNTATRLITLIMLLQRQPNQKATDLAQELGVSRHQLVLAWLLHQRPRVIPIVAASSLDQYEHNLQSLQIHLTDEQLAILNSATA